MRSLPAVALLVPLLAACGGTAEEAPSPSQSPAPSTSASTSPGQGESTAPSAPRGGAALGQAAGSPACAQVRAGIAAFNEGDFATTVERFADAVPLAEDQVDGSASADDLLEAVQWYADLAPEDYPEAARSSADFARYKFITLSQCMPAGAAPSDAPGTAT